MSEVKREWCDWGDMHRDECDHCNGPRESVLVKGAKDAEIEQLRAKVKRAIEEQSVTVRYPLPITLGEKVAMTSTPRWNPGNVAAQIGGHLTAIEEMFEALGEEAEARHSDKEFPGGDALVAMGPGADVEAFGYMQMSALMGRIDEADVVMPERGDIEPPLSFLASWEDVLREERDQPRYLDASIKSSSKYIRDSIDWMMSYDDDGNMNFIAVDDLAEQLGKVRRRMEDVLSAGHRAEFTRVNCVNDECATKPRLMKLWTARVKWDRFRCPECRREYDQPQFEEAKAENMLSTEAEKFMQPRVAADASQVPIKTIYSWMKRRKAERVWVTPMGGNPFALVWWPDIQDLARDRAEKLKRQARRRKERKAEKVVEAAIKAEEKAQDGDRMAS